MVNRDAAKKVNEFYGLTAAGKFVQFRDEHRDDPRHSIKEHSIPQVAYNVFPTDPTYNVRSLVNLQMPELDKMDHEVQAGNHICGVAYPTCYRKKCTGGGKSCSQVLEKNDLVYLNGADTHNICVGLYAVAAYKVTKGTELGCRVGYVKAMFNQLHLITNRMAQVSSVVKKGRNGKQGKWVRDVGGIAEIFYVDRGLVQNRGLEYCVKNAK